MGWRAWEVLKCRVWEHVARGAAWFLGGWCLHLLAGQAGLGECDVERRTPDDWLGDCRRWLRQCLKVYEAQEYEDERLREHAAELVADVDEKLGPVEDGVEEEEDEWEGISDEDQTDDL